MLVEVKPLPKVQWHGKKGKDSFAVPKVIEVLYDQSEGKYATGLSEEDEKKYSKLLGVDLSAIFNPEAPHPYWPTKAAQIVLPNYTLVFDTNRPQEYVKVQNMKASKFVANSLRDQEEGKYPEATHYIIDEEAEVSGRAVKIEQKQKAYAFVSKMSQEDKIAVVQILGSKSLKGKGTDFVNVEVDDLIENDPASFIRLVGMGREEVGDRAMILEGVQKGVINKEASGFFWMGEMIGMDVADAVRWINEPKNQRIKLSILEKLTKSK